MTRCPTCRALIGPDAVICDGCHEDRYITMTADDLGPVAQAIDLALTFDDPQPLPVEVGPGSVLPTHTPTVYALEIADDDPLWALLARCEGCGNAASVDGRWCRGCVPVARCPGCGKTMVDPAFGALTCDRCNPEVEP